MRGPRVIVTRPEPDASRFAEALRAAGFAPLLSPVMEIVWSDAAPALEGVAAIAFTSANGVRALKRLGPLPMLPVYTVGGKTAAEARSAGFQRVFTANGDAGSLGDAIIAARARGVISGLVLHAAGADEAGDLAARLSAEGTPATRAVLYKARALRALSRDAASALRAKPPAEWVAFFSPRTATLFLSSAEQAGADLSHTRAACLSEAVAAAARRANWAEVAVARERSSAALIRAMGRRG